MLVFTGALLLGAATAIIICTVTAAMSAGLSARLAVAGIAGAWVALAVTLAATAPTARLLLPALFFAPLAAIVVVLGSSRAARNALGSIPVHLVISLNAMRLFGVLFLVLAAVGGLAGPFPYAAGIGDIITGAFAVPAASMAARGILNDRRVIAWNVFGLLDLIVAVTLGVTSRNDSPLQLIHAGVGSAAISALPWALISLVLVPLYIVGHLLIFSHIRNQARGTVRKRTLAAAT